MSVTTIEVINRDIDFNSAIKKRNNTFEKKILLTNSISIYRLYKNNKNNQYFDEIIFTDKKQSYYSVSHEVIGLISKINNWFSEICVENNYIKKFLYMVQHCEGGGSSHKIQELTLLNNSYENILLDKKVKKVVIYQDYKNIFENLILVKKCSEKKIILKIHNNFLINKYTYGYINLIKIIIKSIILIIKVSYIKYNSKIKKINKDYVEFQMFSPDIKHWQMIKPTIDSLKEISIKTNISLWGYQNREVQGELDQGGYSYYHMEAEISYVDLLKMIKHIFIFILKYKYIKNKFIQKINSEILYYIACHVMLFEYIERYFIFQAINNFYIRNEPLAIKIWGGDTFAESRITIDVVKKLNNIPKIFFYSIDALGLYEPYAKYYNSPIDWYFASSKLQKTTLQLAGLNSSKIILFGQPKNDLLNEFKIKNDPMCSRNFLNIPCAYDRFIFYDPNYVIRGYLTLEEQIEVLDTILNFAKVNSNVAIIIKPHPRHNNMDFNRYLNYFKEINNLNNIYMIDQHMSPYHAINSADIIIAKFSNIAYEAMLLDKPCISVILDGEEHFNIYKGAAESIKSKNELEKLMRNLLSVNFYNQWKMATLKNQKLFLKNNFLFNQGKISDLIAEYIRNGIHQPKNEYH